MIEAFTNMTKETITLIVTILLAIIGFAFKYFQDRAVARRKDRLDRINLQLRHLYGPLYSISKASDMAWSAFRSKYRPSGSFFRSQPPPTPDDLAAWRLWMGEVFMPLNLQMEKIIIENGDLIIEDEMPSCLMELCAHVDSYKTVLKKWTASDFSEHTALTLFPDSELNEYIDTSYNRLKKQQAELLGRLRISSSA